MAHQMKNGRRYSVGISKAYFPAALRPDLDEFFEVIQIGVASDSISPRLEAARQAWSANGRRWAKLMGPPETSRRRVSLHVNDPKLGLATGSIGRLMPIEVCNLSRKDFIGFAEIQGPMGSVSKPVGTA
jgi:hypothetical protein